MDAVVEITEMIPPEPDPVMEIKQPLIRIFP